MKRNNYVLFGILLLWLWTGCENKGHEKPNREAIAIEANSNRPIPIPAHGKLVDPDSLALPKTVPLLRKPNVVPARNNVFTAKPPSILIADNMSIISPGKNGVPLPDTIYVLQEVVPVRHPRPVPAKPMTVKAEAITDIQYLSVSQGLKSAFIYGILEDRRGNLWIANGGYLSRYDGQHFMHYTSKDGIDIHTVRSMMEDSRGDLWLGGNHGLGRYDGKWYTNFSFEGQRPAVLSMMEDAKGKLWFGTRYGVYCFDPSVDSDRLGFVRWTPVEGLIDRVVQSMLEDRQSNLWFGTSFGLSRYDGKQFTNYLIEIGLTNDDIDIRSMMEDSQGVLWLGTDLGLIRFDPLANAGRGSFANMNIMVGNVNGMTEDEQGNIWVSDYRDGLFCLFRDGSSVGKSYARYTQKEGLNGNYFLAFLKDSHGNIWIGGQNGGVSRINVRNPIRYYNQENGLKGVNVDCLFEDSRGYIWIGESTGALKYDPGSGGTFTKYGTEEGLDPGNGITSIMEDQQGNIWFGSWRGLSRLNTSQVSAFPTHFSNETQTFTYFDVGSVLRSSRVLSMHKDSRGNLWFGNDEGVTYYEPDYWGNGPGLFSYYPLEDRLQIDGPDLQEDQAGNLWIAAGGRVYKLDLNLSNYKINSAGPKATLALSKIADLQRWMEGQTYTLYSTEEGLSNNTVRDITQDSQGMLWFATIDGLSRFDPGASRFYRYGVEDGLLSDGLRAMAEDQRNRLWILSQSGINVVVSDQSEGPTGRSSDVNDYQFFTFSEYDGIYTEDGGFKSIIVTSQNQLWWATGNGVASLDLNNFELSTDTPKINLNSIDIDQTYVDFSSFQDTTYQKDSLLNEQLSGSFDSVAAFNNYPLNLALPHDLNHLTFHYTATDWASPHQLRYTYLMEGMDKSWSELSPETKADYRNLAPGNYTFKVKAIGAAKKWSEVFEYPFKVLPPWWQTWWAYVGYAIILMLIVSRVHLYQKERTIRMEREKTRERELQQAREIEKAYHELQATQTQLIQSEKMASLGELTAGIAHEIQNPLNFVNNFSEINEELIAELKDELKNGNIAEAVNIAEDIFQNEEKIKQHGKRADAIVKSMLQHSRTSSGEKELTDINALCDEYLRLAYHGMCARDKRFNAQLKTELDPQLSKIEVVPQDIGRVLLNLINNAFQSCADLNSLSATHSEALAKEDNDYIPLVIVSTKKLENKVEIRVSDNGAGIPEEIKHKIFQPFFTTKPAGQGTGLGLSLSYDIVKGHGGEIKVESKPEEGTTFSITIPI